MKKRDPFFIEKSNLIGFPAANAEETAEIIQERFGPPAMDEESHLFGTTLMDGDVDPMSESVQRPKGMKR